MKKPLPPFSCVYDPNIPNLLSRLRCSIAISTYQVNKVIFISPNEQGRLTQLNRNFDKAMGISFLGSSMALATKRKIHLFENSQELALTYPKKPRTYDALFMPRVSYYTGEVDIHDLHLAKEEIWAVNTSFSCIVKASNSYNWEPAWKPPQIDSLVSEDRCHLNGLALKNGEPYIATAFGTGNEKKSWRKHFPDGGVMWNISENKMVQEDLKMPHSPRYHEGKIYFTESAEGSIKVMDEQLNVEEIAKIKAFTRGLAIYKDYLFIGKSKIRKSSSVFGKLDLAKEKLSAGISIIHLPSGKMIGEINYLNSVEEIYDVQVLPNFIRPNILSPEQDYHHNALMIPSATFWSKKNQ